MHFRPVFRALLSLLLLGLLGSGGPVGSAQTAAPSPQVSRPAAPEPAPQSAVLPRLEPGRLLGTRGGTVLWALELPRSAYRLPQPVQVGGAVWVAWGPVLRRLDLERGRVEATLHLPARISALEPGVGGLGLEVEYAPGVRERFQVTDDTLLGRPVFLPTQSVTGTLERLARSGLGFDPLRPETVPGAVGLLRARLERDPQNPFLHLFLGRALERSGDLKSAQAAYQAALTLPAPFFVSVRLARLLDSFGFAPLADAALVQARERWGEQGYSPELPLSAEALRAYGDPLSYTLGLERSGSALRRDAWMRFLRDTLPRFEGSPEVYARYAERLRVEGREGEADEWRSFAANLERGTLYGLGPQALSGVRDLMRLSLAVLLLALLLSLLALALRYAGPQRAALRSSGGLLGSWLRHPLHRLRHLGLSYYTFSEKLVLLSLLLALGFSFAALGWAGRTEARASDPALGLGTYGGAWFYARFERLQPDPLAPETALVLGLAAQLDGDTETAASRFVAGGRLAALENNAGALEEGRGNLPAARARYRSALALDPRLQVASDNLARLEGAETTPPRLAYPTQTQLYRALGGVWLGDVQRLLSNPWTALSSTPTRLPPPVQAVGVALYLLWLAAVAVWLLVPRPRAAGLPGRPWGFRLLALLVPGLGLLDEVWGVLLLLPWCVVILHALAEPLSLALPGLAFWQDPPLAGAWLLALLGLYVLNVLALVLEEVGYAQRLRRLRRPPPATPATPPPAGIPAPAAVPLEPGVGLSKPAEGGGEVR